jgi:hypothetical protein
MGSSQSKTRRRAVAALLWAMAACFLSASACAQSVEDNLDQSYHAMYNLQFDEALKKVEDAKALDKNDPLP